jgi:hypothetical protein
MVAPATAASGPALSPIAVALAPGANAPNPNALLLGPVASAKYPTAVAPAPLAVAWQIPLLSKLVSPTLPELHPAIAGAAERTSAPAVKAQLANKATRWRRARSVQRMCDMVALLGCDPRRGVAMRPGGYACIRP